MYTICKHYIFLIFSRKLYENFKTLNYGRSGGSLSFSEIFPLFRKTITDRKYKMQNNNKSNIF